MREAASGDGPVTVVAPSSECTNGSAAAGSVNAGMATVAARGARAGASCGTTFGGAGSGSMNAGSGGSYRGATTAAGSTGRANEGASYDGATFGGSYDAETSGGASYDGATFGGSYDAETMGGATAAGAASAAFTVTPGTARFGTAPWIIARRRATKTAL
ncbi:MAG: hypothetical protein QM820_27400 [Minicystis sp.]